MKTINIIKILGIIGLLFLLPSISNAQIQRVWNIAEYTSTMLPPPATGTKVAYRTLNNSLYYWNGSAWVRIAGPGIIDTSYSLSFTSPNLSLVGSGSSVNLTSLYNAQYGLIKTGEDWRVDTSLVSTKLYTNRFIVPSGQVAVGTGSGLTGYNRLTFNNSLFVQSTSASSGVLLTLQAESGNNRGVRIRADAAGSDNFSFETSLGSLNRFTINFPRLQLRAGGLNTIYFHGTSDSDAGSEIFNNSTVFGGSTGTGYGTRRNQPFGLFHGGADINTSAFNFTASNSNLSTNTYFARFIRASTEFFRIHGNGNIGIAGTPLYILDINSTDAIRIPRGTDAQRPTNAFGIIRGSLTSNFLEAGFGATWENIITSTGASNGQVSVFSSAGKTYGTNRLTWDNTNEALNISMSTLSPSRGVVVTQTNNGIQSATIQFQKIRGSSAVQNGDIIGGFSFRGYSGTQYITDNAFFGAKVTGTVTSTSVPTSIFFNAGATASNVNTTLLIHSGGNVGVGNFGDVTSTLITPSQKLHVKGSTYIENNLGIGQSSPTADIHVTRNANTGTYIDLTNSNTGNSTYSYIRFQASSDANKQAFVGKMGDNVPSAQTRSPGDFFLFNSSIGGDIAIHNHYSSGKIKFANGNISTPQMTLSTNGNLLIGSTTDVSRRLHVSGEVRITDLVTDTPTGIVGSDGDGDLGLVGFAGGLSFASGTLSSKWLATELPTSSVTIATSNILALKNSPVVALKASTAATLAKMNLGGFFAYKAAVSDLEGASVTIADTTKNFAFNIVEKDYTFLGTSGQGNQVVFEMVSPKLSGTYRWPFAFRLDTTTSPATIRIDHGDRYASPSLVPLTNTYYGAMRSGGTQAAHQFISRGSTGQVGFRVSDDATNFLSIRNSGKIYFGSDSTFAFDPSTDVLQLNKMGQGNKEAADLTKTQSAYIASWATDGTLLDYKFARDTFIEDVTLFSVGTLLYDCQELTIVSSMTSLAPTNQEIRFPDAADYLRGKKIIVYSKKKDAGAYVPYISVVGGVSRLFYTTNPGIGGTDPSNQASLYIDDSTWSDHGTTFEFTCLKTDNTPSYRWVLNQR